MAPCLILSLSIVNGGLSYRTSKLRRRSSWYQQEHGTASRFRGESIYTNTAPHVGILEDVDAAATPGLPIQCRAGWRGGGEGLLRRWASERARRKKIQILKAVALSGLSAVRAA